MTLSVDDYYRVSVHRFISSSVLNPSMHPHTHTQTNTNTQMLRFPTPDAPTICKPVSPHPTVQALWESDNRVWNGLGLGCVGDINKLIMAGGAKRLVHLCEASHDRRIVEVRPKRCVLARLNTLWLCVCVWLIFC